MAGGLQNSKIETFREAFKSIRSQRWLEKHTCGLVRLLKKKKVVGNKWNKMEMLRFNDGLNLVKIVE